MSAPHSDLGTMTLREFTDHIRVRPSYGHQLKREGRLVLAEDGKHVLVQASIDRIAATKDPSKAGVADRHAAARGAIAVTGHEPAPPSDQPGGSGEQRDDEPERHDYQGAKAKREHFAAEREQMAYRKDAGELMEVEAVVSMLADAGTLLRTQLEGWADTLAPQLVGRDEPSIRALIADHVETSLQGLSDKFARLAEGER